MVIGAKHHSNSAYPPKFLVKFEAKYLPQISPEAVSEHEYVKISWGGMPPDPPRGAWIFIRFLDLPLYNPPKSKCLDPPLVCVCVCVCVWGLVVKWFAHWAHDPWVMGSSPTTRRCFPCLPPPPPVHPAVNGYLA